MSSERSQSYLALAAAASIFLTGCGSGKEVSRKSGELEKPRGVVSAEACLEGDGDIDGAVSEIQEMTVKSVTDPERAAAHRDAAGPYANELRRTVLACAQRVSPSDRSFSSCVNVGFKPSVDAYLKGREPAESNKERPSDKVCAKKVAAVTVRLHNIRVALAAALVSRSNEAARKKQWGTPEGGLHPLR
ncbi:MAG: hypothetical protein WCT53_01475 [Candidatus Gracilibacteria bacterium]